MTDPTPPKVQEPNTFVAKLKAMPLDALIAKVRGLSRTNPGWVGTGEATRELCDRLNAPAPASHGEREAFEAWARGEGMGPLVWEPDENRWRYDDIQRCWLAYQAALQSRATLLDAQYDWATWERRWAPYAMISTGTQDARAAESERARLGQIERAARDVIAALDMSGTAEQNWQVWGAAVGHLRVALKLLPHLTEGSAAKEKTE